MKTTTKILTAVLIVLTFFGGLVSGIRWERSHAVAQVDTITVVVPADSQYLATKAPDSRFVVLGDYIPDLIQEIRYYTTYNFIGHRVEGYEMPVALVTREAAEALKKVSDDLKAQGYSSDTNYLILCDKSTFTVCVYKGKKGAWKRQWISVCATPSGNQFDGTFTVTGKTYESGTGYSSWYVTEGLGSGSIHSELYTEGSKTNLWWGGQLGNNETHGCYRLPIDLAKYIYDHVPIGSTMVVYNA